MVANSSLVGQHHLRLSQLLLLLVSLSAAHIFFNKILLETLTWSVLWRMLVVSSSSFPARCCLRPAVQSFRISRNFSLKLRANSPKVSVESSLASDFIVSAFNLSFFLRTSYIFNLSTLMLNSWTFSDSLFHVLNEFFKAFKAVASSRGKPRSSVLNFFILELVVIVSLHHVIRRRTTLSLLFLLLKNHLRVKVVLSNKPVNLLIRLHYLLLHNILDCVFWDFSVGFTRTIFLRRLLEELESCWDFKRLLLLILLLC